VPEFTSSELLAGIRAGNIRALAQGITLVENNLPPASEMLRSLQHTATTQVVGITGPPGAGKSTLVNALLEIWVAAGKKIAVLAVDPSSPFNFGALLGDRVRMTKFYTNPLVYIRSFASRGSLGGLHPALLQVTDLVKEGGFDVILIETVGVGQSEVEIAGLADCTVVTLVPEAGDEIQAMKQGLLEIADIFVVNKGDRPGADGMVKRLRNMAHERMRTNHETPVFKTVASKEEGISALAEAIVAELARQDKDTSRKALLLTDKLLQYLAAREMARYSRSAREAAVTRGLSDGHFNLYRLADSFMETKS
jgi:LAO/AO transport system kinase